MYYYRCSSIVNLLFFKMEYDIMQRQVLLEE